MNPENFSPRNLEKKEEERKKEKRGKVLRAITAASVIVFGGIVGYGVSKDIEKDHKEQEVAVASVDVQDMSPEDLKVYLGNDVENFEKANHVANIILIEMNNVKVGDKVGVDKISTKSGTNVLDFTENERLVIAKGFLVRHLNSKAGHKHDVREPGMRERIRNNEFITRTDLANILSNTTR